MLRKYSQGQKAEPLITEGRLATGEFRQIQFTGSEFLNSQESQKGGTIKLSANRNEFEVPQNNMELAPKRKISSKLSVSSEIRPPTNKEKNQINVTPHHSNFRSNAPQLMHMNQFNFKNQRRVSMGQFSFWSVVQIRKMMERLKQKYAYANLTNLQYDLIGDKSVVKLKKENLKEKYGYQAQVEEERNYFLQMIQKGCRKLYSYYLKKRMLVFAQTIVDYIPVFNPQSPLKLLWDFLISLSMLLFFFITPVHIAVSLPMTVVLDSTLLYISLALIVADILVTVNTGYFSKGQIVTNRTMILNYYVKNSFIGDVIATIPFFFTIPQTDYSFFPSILTLLVFIKVRDFSKILKKIEEQFLLKPTTTNLVELLKLLFFVLFVAHLGACVWIFQGLQSQQKQKWFQSDKLDDTWEPHWLDLYVKAYYYNTVTMVTVGYGDIYPVNNYERLLSIGTILVACCIFAFIVNSIGRIFQDFFRHSQEVKDNFYAINNYMEKKNISSALKNKIKEYLSYYWDEERDNLGEKEQKIITQLPESLKKELKVEANKIVLQDAPIFHQNFSKFINEKICSIIQEQRCHPEQIITKEDEQDDSSIYFIQKGRVEVFIKQFNPEGVQTSKSIMVLEKGQYFGTYGFFTGLTRKQSIRCMEFSQFLVIKRSDFIETLRQYSDDYEKFCMIRDQLMFNSKNSGIDQSCFSCNSKDHVFLDCPVIHYAPNQQKIIRKYNFTSTHHVRKKQQRSFFKYHTLKESEQTIKDAIKFLEQNESFLLEQDWLESGSEDSQSDSESSQTDDSREALDQIDKHHNINILNAIPSAANLVRGGTVKSSKLFESANDLKNTNSNSHNELDLIKKIEQIDEVQSHQYHGDTSTKNGNQDRDDFNLGDQKPSPIPKVLKRNTVLINNDNQNIQTKKILLNPSKSLFLAESQEYQNQRQEERNGANNDATVEFKFSQSKNLFDVSLGPKQLSGFNVEKVRQDSDRLSRRQSYFNMKVNVPVSIRDIQFSKQNSQALIIDYKEQKTPSLTNLGKATDLLYDVVANEAISQRGMIKAAESINQFSSLSDSQQSIDIQPVQNDKIQTNNQNNLSMIKSLPKFYQFQEDDKRDSDLQYAFDMQRFDDIEGLVTERSSPKFLAKRNSQKSNIDEEILATSSRNQNGDTQRKLLPLTLKSSTNTESLDSDDQKQTELYLQQQFSWKNNNNNNQTQINNLFNTNQNQDVRLNLSDKPIPQSPISNIEQRDKSSYSYSPHQKKSPSNKYPKNGDNGMTNIRIPLERTHSISQEDSGNKNLKKLVISKAASYKKLPTRNQKAQYAHQTSIELNPKMKSNQLQLLTKKQSTSQNNQQNSNLMLGSVNTYNSNSKSIFTNQNLPSNQQFLEQNPQMKPRKSILNNLNLVSGQYFFKDKVSPMINEINDYKALKKEKFWKNLQKHGHVMGVNDQCSPLVVRAKQKLDEINTDSGQNTGNNQNVKQAKSNSFLPTITNMGQNAMEDSSKSLNKNYRNSKKDYSPNSSISRRGNTDQQIQANQAENAQIETLNKLMCNLLFKFDEIKGQIQPILHPPRHSIIFDQLRQSPLDFIDENKQGNYNQQFINSPLLNNNQMLPLASPLKVQMYPQQNSRGNQQQPNNDDQIVNSNYQQDFYFVQELIFDTLKNFTRYFPDNNISVIQNDLNKIANEKLKQMKKLKKLKAKANQHLLNSLDYLSREQQFKRRLLNSRFAKQSLHNTRQEQSEDDAVSDKSRSHSGSNSKRKTYFGHVNENFSSAVNQLNSKPSYSISQQSINVNQLGYLNQLSHLPNYSQKYSQFKH